MADLVRVFRVGDGLELGVGPGRGAWLCADRQRDCLDEAVRRQSLGRALKAQVAVHSVRDLRARLEPKASEQ